MNRKSASVYPCSTPVVVSKKGVSPSGDITMERVFLYSVNMVFMISLGMPHMIISYLHDLLNYKPLKVYK